jgi:hypothetical protein
MPAIHSGPDTIHFAAKSMRSMRTHTHPSAAKTPQWWQRSFAKPINAPLKIGRTMKSMAYHRNRTTYDQPPVSPESQTREDIRRAVKMLFLAFGKRDDPDMVSFWVNRLEPLASARLYSALTQACEGDKFPSLRSIAMASAEQQRANARKEIPPLTAEEKKRADNAAILSMLWLHYEKNWRLEDFGGHVLGRLFGGNPQELLVKAKAHYDRATVAKWMEAQQ